MKLIILGRDGVINERRDGPISETEDCIPIPGSLGAIARLSHAGHRIVVVASATGLESGMVDADSLNRIHEKLQLSVVNAGGHLDAIFFSPQPDLTPSGPEPEVRLLREIATRRGLDLADVPAVGDTLDHVLAAREAGARPVLLGTCHGASTNDEKELAGVAMFDDLSIFVEHFLLESSDAGA